MHSYLSIQLAKRTQSERTKKSQSELRNLAGFGGLPTSRGNLTWPDTPLTALTVEPVFFIPLTSTPLVSHKMSSSKRKWDQAAPEVDPEMPSKATKTEETKTASEAAATAAAIAAKIAAQFANGGTGGGGKDPYDGEFTHDIDINDLRNRYLLTKGSTQQQVRTNRVSDF